MSHGTQQKQHSLVQVCYIGEKKGKAVEEKGNGCAHAAAELLEKV
jgi:hypothetical protein